MRSRGAVVVAAVLLLATACTVKTAGEPAADSVPAQVASDSTATAVAAPPPSVATLREAQRIAAVTALVQTTFPDRTRRCDPGGPQLEVNPLSRTYFGNAAIGTILTRYGFVAGWGQCAGDAQMHSTRTLVVELSDPESASRAAEQLTAAVTTGSATSTALPSGTPAVIERRPDVESVRAWIAVGRMLGYVSHDAAPGRGLDGAGLVMADQRVLLRKFVPTPQAAVAALPADPAGLADRTLNPPGESTLLTGSYDLEGYLRLATDPLAERRILTANGFSGAFTRHTSQGSRSYALYLFHFPGPAQASAVFRSFADIDKAAYGGVSVHSSAVPSARCLSIETDGHTYYQRCYLQVNGYVASVDVGRLSQPDDLATMNEILRRQQNLISR